MTPPRTSLPDRLTCESFTVTLLCSDSRSEREMRICMIPHMSDDRWSSCKGNANMTESASKTIQNDLDSNAMMACQIVDAANVLENEQSMSNHVSSYVMRTGKTMRKPRPTGCI
jgi:proline dehydrogenase